MSNGTDPRLIPYYKHLASDPAWLDLLSIEQGKIDRDKEKFWNDDTIEKDKLAEKREEIRLRQKMLTDMKLRVNNISAKEQTK